MAAKRKGARYGAKLGDRVAPPAGRLAGKMAWKAGKGQAKLARQAMSSREPKGARLLKYGLFALAGFALGALVSRSGSDDSSTSSSYTDATGPHSPDPGSPAGQRGETWGSGTPTGSAGGGAGAAGATGTASAGAERGHSDPSSGPLIGERHRGTISGVGESQDEVVQRIRTRIGEDARTRDMPRPNVEVNDGVAELRGVAPSEDVREAAGEIARETEGVTEVRNLMSIG